MHVDAWQRPAQYCKTIILQLKIKTFFKKCKVGIWITTNKDGVLEVRSSEAIRKLWFWLSAFREIRTSAGAQKTRQNLNKREQGKNILGINDTQLWRWE